MLVKCSQKCLISKWSVFGMKYPKFKKKAYDPHTKNILEMFTLKYIL